MSNLRAALDSTLKKDTLAHLTCGYTAATHRLMAPRGSRYFGMRLFDFWERHTGPDAKAGAAQQAEQLRDEGYFVRIVKVGDLFPNWCVYRLKDDDSRRYGGPAR